MEEKKFSIVVKGGIGKHICATTLVRYIKEKYPDSIINVISAFPEMFHYNPKVNRNLHLATPYLYDDYIKGTEYLEGDPYIQKEFYTNKSHINALYPLAYGFKEKNKNVYPELFLSQSELNAAKGLCQDKNPVITLQTTGGNQQKHQMKDPMELTGRDIKKEVAEIIVKVCKQEGYNVLHVKLPHEYKLEGTMEFKDLPIRRYIALIPFIRGHIGIDSVMMHAVAAFKKPGLIFWGNTNKDALGYPNMVNKFRDACPMPMCSRPHFSMPDFMSEGRWVCPHNYKCQDWTEEEITPIIKSFLNSIKETNRLKIPLNKEHKNINAKNKKDIYNDNKTETIQCPTETKTIKIGK